MDRRSFLKLSLFGLLAPVNVFGSSNVYLTIDDGPRKFMDGLLDNLRVEDKLTFFMVGELLNTKNGYRRACRALELGHVIGNHSYSHPSFSNISFDSTKREIEKTEKLIDLVYRDVGFVNPKLFRFPYGDPGHYYKFDKKIFIKECGDISKKKEISEFLKERGYVDFLWDLDTEDWRFYAKKDKKREMSEILDNCNSVSNLDIVLMHDLPITRDIVIPFFIEKAKEEGYNFVSLRECL